MNAALGLVGAGPPAAAGVLARSDPAGAWSAADRRVAVVDQRVDQHPVLGDVALHLLVAPSRERGDLDLALLGVPADYRRDDPVVGLGAAQPGGPGVVRRERVGQGLHLAQRAALV